MPGHAPFTKEEYAGDCIEHARVCPIHIVHLCVTVSQHIGYTKPCLIPCLIRPPACFAKKVANT